MPDRAEIDAHLQYGRGRAAEITGQPYDVYRITAGSNGDVLSDGNKIASGISIIRKPARGFKVDLETPTRLDTIWYDLTGDLTDFRIGDIFVLTDSLFGAGKSYADIPTSDVDGFCLASRKPIRKASGARLSTTIQIFRPGGADTSGGQWGASGPGESKPIKLVNGQFVLGTYGASDASWIPAELLPTGNTLGDKTFADIPGAERKSAWKMYVPPTSGFIFHEGDQVISKEGAKFRVIIAYHQETGEAGSQCTLEKESPI